jgi:TonB-dependent SusC/RagA subfamily outer membrane receptor
MKKFIIAALLFAVAISSQSAVEGRIEKDGKALSGVLVWTLGTKEKPVKTKKRGDFKIAQTMQEDSLFVQVTMPDLDNKAGTKKLFIIPLPFSDNIVNIKLTKDYELSDVSIQRNENEELQSQYGGTLITREGLEATKETDLLKAISMRTSGVQYINGNLQIRGTQSIKLNTSPLYVINGVETFSPPFLQVQEVESVEILKDTSTSMFGIRGSNGVVVINMR